MGYSHPREEEEETREVANKEDIPPPLKMRRLESPVKEEFKVMECPNGDCKLDEDNVGKVNGDFRPVEDFVENVKPPYVESKANFISDQNENNDVKINQIKDETSQLKDETSQIKDETLFDQDEEDQLNGFEKSTGYVDPESESDSDEEEASKSYPSTKELLGPAELPDVDEDIWKPRTFYPTYEEFKDLKKLITFIESTGAHKCGIAKIVPPKEWIPRKKGYNPSDIDIELDHPVQQNISVTEVEGAFKTISDRSIPHFSVDKYMRLATNEKYITPPHNSYEELEDLYWKQNVDDKLPAPIYGADVCDSITDPEEKVWNIKRLDSLLTEVMEEQIPGVNMPYLYFGMWKATFSWHIEDMDLYGVNFLHYGAPKTWYCIPPSEGYKLEQVAQKLFPDMTQACYNLLRHKAIMISPKLLEANGVRVNKMVQEERNMIIVFPHAYHSGFNHGFNMAESTNFALPRWVEYGKRFRDCLCRGQDDEVSIDLDPFIKRVQPERHEAWRKGLDWALHPVDPWFLKRLYLDAQVRLERGEISEYEMRNLKREVKKKRKIPDWFKDRFELDYSDDLKYLDVDMTDCIEVLESPDKLASPKIKSAKRKLMDLVEEGRSNVKVNLSKSRLRTTTANIYLEEMKAYEEMKAEIIREEQERKEKVAKGKGEYSLGSGAARGVGFVGAQMEDLLEKKSRIVCKAKKKHRFKACAKCTGCRTENCGECEYCLDMPRFGGLGVIKQKCQLRVCVNPVVSTCDQCVWTI